MLKRSTLFPAVWTSGHGVGTTGRVVDVDVLLPVRDVPPRWWACAVGSTARSRGVRARLVVVDHGSAEPVVVPERALRGGAIVEVVVVQVARPAPFAAALAAGLAACRAPFVARMDADDVMHPWRLRAQREALQADARLGAVGSRVKALPRTTTAMHGYLLWQNALLTPADHARDLWIEQPLCHPATTFRRQAVVEVGGYVVADGPEDYDLFLRLHTAGWALAKLAAVHHGWRQHAQQTTRTQPTHSRDHLAGVKVRHLVGHHGLAHRPVVVAGAGKEGRRIARALRGAGVLVAGFVDVDPKKVGRLLHGVPVWPTSTLVSRPAATFVIGAVGTSGARGAVRALLRDAGLVEGEDAVVVA